MKKNEIKIKMKSSGDAIAQILEDIAASIKSGTVCVQLGDDFVTLTPSDSMDVEMEAVQKKGKQKLVMEFNWREVVPVSDVGPDLTISSEEPEIEEPEIEAEPEETAEEEEDDASEPEV